MASRGTGRWLPGELSFDLYVYFDKCAKKKALRVNFSPWERKSPFVPQDIDSRGLQPSSRGFATVRDLTPSELSGSSPRKIHTKPQKAASGPTRPAAALASRVADPRGAFSLVDGHAGGCQSLDPVLKMDRPKGSHLGFSKQIHPFKLPGGEGSLP